MSARAQPWLALRQLRLLLGIWWLHLRRRPLRVGDAPKPSGVPTFLLINLLSLAYMLPLTFRGVTEDMKQDGTLFGWHVLGSSALALGSGVAKGAATFQFRGGRGDEFLAALPLSLLARLGLQCADDYVMVLVALAVALAGAVGAGHAGLSALSSVGLGLVAYFGAFVLGQAAIAWARSLGPPSAARYGGYLGAGLLLAGFPLVVLPVHSVLESGLGTATLTGWWLGQPGQQLALLAVGCALVTLAYGALAAAERRGFDRLEPGIRTPRANGSTANRAALEARMVWRQGARVQVPLLALMLAGGAGFILTRLPARSMAAGISMLGFFAIYAGALQIINQAGGAVRRDLKARALLAALPLSPYQVLDGKAAVLRKLLVPTLLMLSFVASLALRYQEPGLAYRTLLGILALYLAVDGAVSIAFMSSGLGIVGVGGGQVGSSFSTQLLLMPLMAILITTSNWSATVACLTVGVLAREAGRAARHSVRWLDDPDDAVERDTSVWRALLAITVFFSSQIFIARLLSLFAVPAGYVAASAFFAGALVLSLLTWRDAAGLLRPRFQPNRRWCWLLAIAGGSATALLSSWFVRELLPTPGAAPLSYSRGESVALAATAVVLAPLAEEYFFRGWLQRAIEQDLADALKPYAFAVGALAFALAHVGSYALPQLLLGLVAGALYAQGRGLGPAMLAHAVHNGVALWVTLPYE